MVVLQNYITQGDIMLVNQELSWKTPLGFDTFEGSVMYHYDKQSNIFYGLA